MRKIIQIATSDNDIIALCDDGTVWRWAYGRWSMVDLEGIR